jgi:hypothetical protein
MKANSEQTGGQRSEAARRDCGPYQGRKVMKPDSEQTGGQRSEAARRDCEPYQGRKRTRTWLRCSNHWIHGVRRAELVLVKTRPSRSIERSSVSIFSIPRPVAIIAGLAGLILLLLLVACQTAVRQQGGHARTMISRPGQSNAAALAQSENPKEPSSQTVQSEQTVEYILPAGTPLEWPSANGQLVNRGDSAADSQGRAGRESAGPAGIPAGAPAILNRPIPLRMVTKDRTETRIGGAQKDALGEWAGKAARLQPVLWAGIAMMTLVAGVLIYFGWWTKAAVAMGVGAGMIVLAETLPEHGALILFGGLGVFSLAALLVLYSYYKGQWDQNKNGIPDFLEPRPQGGTQK